MTVSSAKLMSTRRPGLWLPAHSDDTDLGDALLRRHFGRPRPACHEGPLRVKEQSVTGKAQLR